MEDGGKHQLILYYKEVSELKNRILVHKQKFDNIKYKVNILREKYKNRQENSMVLLGE